MGLIDSHAHLDYEDFTAATSTASSRARARLASSGSSGRPLAQARATSATRSSCAARDPGFFTATIGDPPARVRARAGGGLGDSARLAADPRGRRGRARPGSTTTTTSRRARCSAPPSAARSGSRATRRSRSWSTCARPTPTARAILREEGVPPAAASSTASPATRPRRAPTSSSGLHISVAGVVTFKTADAIRDAVRIVPRDRLLVETDSPFLAPVPFRGKRNEPAHVVEDGGEGGGAVGGDARRGRDGDDREREAAVPPSR